MCAVSEKSNRKFKKNIREQAIRRENFKVYNRLCQKRWIAAACWMRRKPEKKERKIEKAHKWTRTKRKYDTVIMTVIQSKKTIFFAVTSAEIISFRKPPRKMEK